jgi:phosphoheptose isomerase
MWAKKNDLRTVALVGARRGRMAEVAEQMIIVNAGMPPGHGRPVKSRPC